LHCYFSFSPNKKKNKSSPDFIPIDIFLNVSDVSSQGLQDKNDISRIYEKYGQSELKVLRDNITSILMKNDN
jgi:hypothetical protein